MPLSRRSFLRLLGFATAALAVDPSGLAAPEAVYGRRYDELFTATLHYMQQILVDQIHEEPPLIHYLQARGDQGAHALAVHLDKKLLEGGDEA